MTKKQKENKNDKIEQQSLNARRETDLLMHIFNNKKMKKNHAQ